MRIEKKKYIFVFVVVMAILAGYLLPDAFNLLQDNQLNHEKEPLHLQRAELQMKSEVSVIQKFIVLESASSIVELEAGQKMSLDEADAFAKMGIAMIFDAGYGSSYPADLFELKEHRASLFVYEDASVLAWSFLYEDEVGNQLQVLMDDMSGQIFSLKLEFAEGQNILSQKQLIYGVEGIKMLGYQYLNHLMMNEEFQKDVNYSFGKSLTEVYDSEVILEGETTSEQAKKKQKAFTTTLELYNDTDSYFIDIQMTEQYICINAL